MRIVVGVAVVGLTLGALDERWRETDEVGELVVGSFDGL